MKTIRLSTPIFFKSTRCAEADIEKGRCTFYHFDKNEMLPESYSLIFNILNLSALCLQNPQNPWSYSQSGK
jgi:hypothetical protein